MKPISMEMHLELHDRLISNVGKKLVETKERLHTAEITLNSRPGKDAEPFEVKDWQNKVDNLIYRRDYIEFPTLYKIKREYQLKHEQERIMKEAERKRIRDKEIEEERERLERILHYKSLNPDDANAKEKGKQKTVSPHKSYKQQLAEKKRRQQEEIEEALRATADFAKLGHKETKKSEDFSHPGYKLTGNIPFLAPFRDQSENPNTHANTRRTNSRRQKEVEYIKSSNFSSSNSVLTNGSSLTFQDWELGEEFDIGSLYNNISNEEVVEDSNKGDPFKHKKFIKRSISLNNTSPTPIDNNSGFSPYSRYNRYTKSPTKSLSPIKKRFTVKDYTKNALIYQNKDNFLQLGCENDQDNEDGNDDEYENRSANSSSINSHYTDKINDINIFQLNKANYVNKERNSFHNIYFQKYCNNDGIKSISTVSQSDDATNNLVMDSSEQSVTSTQIIKKSRPKLFIDKYKNISNAIDSFYNKNEISIPKRYNRLKEGVYSRSQSSSNLVDVSVNGILLEENNLSPDDELLKSYISENDLNFE